MEPLVNKANGMVWPSPPSNIDLSGLSSEQAAHLNALQALKPHLGGSLGSHSSGSGGSGSGGDDSGNASDDSGNPSSAGSGDDSKENNRLSPLAVAETHEARAEADSTPVASGFYGSHGYTASPGGIAHSQGYVPVGASVGTPHTHAAAAGVTPIPVSGSGLGKLAMPGTKLRFSAKKSYTLGSVSQQQALDTLSNLPQGDHARRCHYLLAAIRKQFYEINDSSHTITTASTASASSTAGATGSVEPDQGFDHLAVGAFTPRENPEEVQHFLFTAVGKSWLPSGINTTAVLNPYNTNDDWNFHSLAPGTSLLNQAWAFSKTGYTPLAIVGTEEEPSDCPELSSVYHTQTHDDLGAFIASSVLNDPETHPLVGLCPQLCEIAESLQDKQAGFQIIRKALPLLESKHPAVKPIIDSISNIQSTKGSDPQHLRGIVSQLYSGASTEVSALGTVPPVTSSGDELYMHEKLGYAHARSGFTLYLADSLQSAIHNDIKSIFYNLLHCGLSAGDLYSLTRNV